MFRSYYERIRHPSRRMIFAMLMVGSAVAVLAPRDLLRSGRHMTELIALPQWAAHQVTRSAVEPVRALAREGMTAAEARRLAEEKTLLENENAALRDRIAALDQTVRELALLRRSGAAEGGALIPAPVVAADAAPGRETLLVGRGRLRGVQREDWVASRMLVRAGEPEGVENGAAVLGRQCLLGWVEETGPFTSRVVLLSDPYAQRVLRVHIAHSLRNGPDAQSRELRFVTMGGRVAEFVLRGVGGGRMIVNDIPHDFVDAGLITPGDLVLSDSRDPKLGQALVVGEITEVRHNKSKPLLYDTYVQPRFDPKSLSQVLIVDRSRHNAPDNTGNDSN